MKKRMQGCKEDTPGSGDAGRNFTRKFYEMNSMTAALESSVFYGGKENPATLFYERKNNR